MFGVVRSEGRPQRDLPPRSLDVCAGRLDEGAGPRRRFGSPAPGAEGEVAKARTTFEKRRKELARQQHRKDKEEKRLQRQKEKEERPPPAGDEDPDIAGVVPGPQPLPEEML